jgi:hypothetical protein
VGDALETFSILGVVAGATEDRDGCFETVLFASATSRSTGEIDPGDPTVWLQTEAVAIEFHCGAPR